MAFYLRNDAQKMSPAKLNPVSGFKGNETEEKNLAQPLKTSVTEIFKKKV